MVVREEGKVFYRVSITSKRGVQVLWYALDESFAELISNTCDAALLGLLIPVMAIGEEVYIDGVMSDKLLYNVPRLQRLLQHVMPSLHQVKIIVKDVYSGDNNRASGVATGFSGGIDSYCLLADHYYWATSEQFKVSHLLFNNVGSHGSGGENLFRKRYKRLALVAERLGLPFVMINSNLDAFYGRSFGFQQTHTLRNASVALLLQGGLGRYMYASAFSYAYAFVGPTSSMAYCDTITLPLLSTEILEASSVGSEYTRVEKVLRVAEIPDSYDTIDVCVNANYAGEYINCSRCWKCMRTLATLEIAGFIERYSPSFDLSYYWHRRSEYFRDLLARQGRPQPNDREVIQFAQERGYLLPTMSNFGRIYAAFRQSTLRFGRRFLRKVKDLASTAS